MFGFITAAGLMLCAQERGNATIEIQWKMGNNIDNIHAIKNSFVLNTDKSNVRRRQRHIIRKMMRKVRKRGRKKDWAKKEVRVLVHE